ncbi:MAG TPA: ATP-dependent DNA helicase [Actinocrinis sp.]|nr:ATP-dependent DNA helicase [Actinocrinis sp.]
MTPHQPGPRQVIESVRDLRRLLGVPYTDQQLEAIGAGLEPGVIVAGAGSGKTTVMAARVVWLVGSGQVAPGEVLGLTFTNKAAAELRERVDTALRKAGLYGDEDSWGRPGADAAAGLDDLAVGVEPVISTYHAYSDRLIKEHGLRLGLEPSARLLADANRYTLAARAVRTARGPFEHLRGSIAAITADLLELDGELSEHVVDPDRLLAADRAFARPAGQRRDPRTGRSVRGVARTGAAGARTARRTETYLYQEYLNAAAVAGARGELLTLVEAYRKLKRDRDFIDFGDQMALGTRLAEAVPEVGRIERERYRVVLLDEYQDTSVAQRRMLAGLFSGPAPAAGLGHAVTAVGDPCQSIYGWRGASAENIDDFPDHFARANGAPAKVYSLSENRRSGERLLAFANRQSVRLREAHKNVQMLEPCDERLGQGRAIVAQLLTHAEEIRWIGQQVQAAGRHVPWSQIAVLVRKGNQIPDLYAELHRIGVPVEVVGLSGLLDLPEVADLVAMLQVLDDPIANAPLVRLLTGPRWRIGPRDLALLGRRARELVRPPDPAGPVAALDRAAAHSDPSDIVSLSDALADPGEELAFSAEARARFARFAAEIRTLRRSLSEPVLDVLHRIMQTTGLDMEIAASPAAFRQRCADTVGAFLRVAGNFADPEGEQSSTAFRAYLRACAEHERGLEIDLPPSENETVKILTMHKAKGLEWECVVVPHQYRQPLKAEAWTTKRFKVPHELRGDRVPLLDEHQDKPAFAEFAAEMKERAELEDARLQYVTLTRAKNRLVMSSHWWGRTQKRPLPPSELLVQLREYCEQSELHGEVATWCPPPVEETNPALVDKLEISWPPGPADPLAQERRRAAADAVVERMRRAAVAAGGEAGGAVPVVVAVVPSAEAARAVAGTAQRPLVDAEFAGEEPPDEEFAGPEPDEFDDDGFGYDEPPEPELPEPELPERELADREPGEPELPGRGQRSADPFARAAREPAADHAPDASPDVLPDDLLAAQASPDDRLAFEDLGLETRRLVEGWDRDIEALLGELRRAREVRQEVRLPRALSTTRLMALVADPSGFAEELFRPMPRRPAATARRGTEFHAWVEQRFGQLPLFDEMDLGLSADEELTGPDELDELKEAFLAGEFAEREPYRIEAPFQLLLAGQIVRGRIDAVYRTDDGGFEVVDWKTNRAETADPLQLAVYRLAWAEYAGVPIEQVGAAFVYVRTGAVRRHTDLPGREALERLIAERARAGGSP